MCNTVIGTARNLLVVDNLTLTITCTEMSAAFLVVVRDHNFPQESTRELPRKLPKGPLRSLLILFKGDKSESGFNV